MEHSVDHGPDKVDHHADEHEIAALADSILDEARQSVDRQSEEGVDYDAAVRYASDIAEAHFKYGRSGGIESARAAFRVAAAGAIAPELKVERDEAQRAAKVDALTGLANQAAFHEA